MPWREDDYPFAKGSHGWRVTGGRHTFRDSRASCLPSLHLCNSECGTKGLNFVFSNYFSFNHRTLSLEIEKGGKEGIG